MFVKIDNCIFDTQERLFWNILVSSTGLRMDPDKAKAIVIWPCPTNIKDV
jgi:hypothetical protein